MGVLKSHCDTLFGELDDDDSDTPDKMELSDLTDSAFYILTSTDYHRARYRVHVGVT